MEKLSEHLKDEDVLAYLYGAGSAADHIGGCPDCQARVDELRRSRANVEAEYRPEEDVSFDFLAAQRRNIYARIDSQSGWHVNVPRPRWMSAAAAVLILCGGAALVEQHRPPTNIVAPPHLSDAQLANDVSDFAASSEPQPLAPLHELFDSEAF